jgi:hypothetical protein
MEMTCRARILYFSLVLLLFVYKPCPGANKTMAENPRIRSSLPVPKIDFETEAGYLNGFPKFVAFTFVNQPGDGVYLALSKIQWIPESGHSVSWRFTSKKNPKRSIFINGTAEGCPTFKLSDGERRKFIVDISSLVPDLPEDDYNLVATLLLGGSAEVSTTPMVFSVRNPSPEDSLQSIRLRQRGNPSGKPCTWTEFLTDNWKTVTGIDKLSDTAWKKCILHFFLHRAFYGPLQTKDLSYDELDGLSESIVFSQAQLLKYEILYAQRKSNEVTAFKESLMELFPGCAADLSIIENGDGLLAKGRRLYGAGQELINKPIKMPYTE